MLNLLNMEQHGKSMLEFDEKQIVRIDQPKIVTMPLIFDFNLFQAVFINILTKFKHDVNVLLQFILYFAIKLFYLIFFLF